MAMAACNQLELKVGYLLLVAFGQPLLVQSTTTDDDCVVGRSKHSLMCMRLMQTALNSNSTLG